MVGGGEGKKESEGKDSSLVSRRQFHSFLAAVRNQLMPYPSYRYPHCLAVEEKDKKEGERERNDG